MSHIHRKGKRGKPLTEQAKKSNRTKSTARVRVEHVFGAQTNDMGGTLVRTVGCRARQGEDRDEELGLQHAAPRPVCAASTRARHDHRVDHRADPPTWQQKPNIKDAARRTLGRHEADSRRSPHCVTQHVGLSGHENRQKSRCPLAYRSEAMEARLHDMRLMSHIHRKCKRGKPLTEQAKKSNRTKSTARVRVEHVFGAQANDMGCTLVRSIGLVRARAKIGTKNLAYIHAAPRPAAPHQPVPGMTTGQTSEPIRPRGWKNRV